MNGFKKVFFFHSQREQVQSTCIHQMLEGDYSYLKNNYWGARITSDFFQQVLCNILGFFYD